MGSKPARILVVDDREEARLGFTAMIWRGGNEAICFERARDAFEFLRSEAVDVALVDLFLGPGECGFETIERLGREHPALPVIAISGMPGEENAIRALKCSAVEFLPKNCGGALLNDAIRRAVARRASPEAGREPDAASDHRERIVGSGAAMTLLRDRIARVKDSDASLLLRGESGTGKSMIARMIHDLGPRAGSPFLQRSVSGLPEPLVAAELFGCERGAYTGAMSSRPGWFESAGGGTLFLDEVCDIPLAVQPLLLRALEEHTFERLGSCESRPFRARVICATNRDLGERVRRGEFRADLYHRIRCLEVAIPPLREHAEDIPELVGYFLARPALRSVRAIRRVDPAAMDFLRSHIWPGNVRELMGALHHAVTFHGGYELGIGHLPDWLVAAAAVIAEQCGVRAGEGGTDPGRAGSAESVARRPGRPRKRPTVERVLAALRAEGEVASRAARRLGVSRSTFYDILRDLEDSGLRASDRVESPPAPPESGESPHRDAPPPVAPPVSMP